MTSIVIRVHSKAPTMAPKPPPLLVGVVEDRLYASHCFIRGKQRCKSNGNSVGRGIDIEIFEAAMSILKWDYKYVLLESRDYGTLNNGSWTGLVGMIASGRVDCAALSMRIDEQRVQAVDFSFPINQYQSVFFVKQDQEVDTIRFMFEPFQMQVWTCLIIALLVMTAVHAIALFSLRQPKNKVQSVSDCFWQLLAVLLKQYYTNYHYISRVIMIVFWTISCLIITIFYQSTMNSILAVPLPPKMPFQSLPQLIKVMSPEGWHLVYFDNVTKPRCPPSHCEAFAKALQSTPIVVEPNFRKMADDVISNKGVYYGSEDIQVIQDSVTAFDNKNDFAAIRDDSVNGQWIAFAFSKNFTYKKYFDAALVELLPGTSRIIAQYKRPWDKLQYRAKAQRARLSLDHLGDCFWMVLGGWMVAVMTLIAETYFGNRTSKIGIFEGIASFCHWRHRSQKNVSHVIENESQSDIDESLLF